MTRSSFATPRGILSLLSLLSLSLAALADQRAVSTLAGSVLTSGSADGSGSAALFNDPTGLAMDGSGNLYVADNRNHTIRRLGPDGVVTTLAGRAGQAGSADGTGTNAFFDSPYGLAFDGAGALYVTDTGNHTIRRVTTNGVVTTLAGQPGESGATNGPANLARFNTPLGIAVDRNGLIYVADSANHLIRNVTSAGLVSTLAGMATVWGSEDGVTTNASFNCPVGVAVDANGNVFVSDSNNQTIRKIMPSGAVSTWAGLAGSDGTADGIGTAARFRQPGELKLDQSGVLFVVDSFNHTIRQITPDAVVCTVAGSPGASGATDGLGGGARFFNPYGLAVDGNGNLRVSDTYDQTIRLVYVPIRASVTRAANNSLLISWQAVAGNKYQVQYQSAATGSAWQNLGPTVTATSGTASLPDSPGGAEQRFYRVWLVP